MKHHVSGFIVVGVTALFALSGSAAAQAGVIQGRVVDATSQRPLAGAQVFIPGTGLGTLTNDAGRYLLTGVPAGEHRVRIQIIGYTQVERSIAVGPGETVEANFELGQSAIALDELVVTGQGRARERRELATTVNVIDAEDIALSPAVSVDQLLQGRLPGGTVNATSAQPGTAGLINFRGVSSVFGSQTPVIYVDGVRVDTDMSTALGTGGEQSSALADILAMDIERIEVTKGGAASTLYGSDAASGVIQIFTKKGLPGDPRINVRIEQGFDQPELKYILDTGEIFGRMDVIPEDELDRSLLRDEFFSTGYHQNYYVGVSGGVSAFTYNVSGRIQDGEGVQPKNESQVFALRGGIQAEVNDRVQLDFAGNYNRSNFGRLYNGTAIADPLTTFEVGDALFFSGQSTLEGALEQFLMPTIDEEVSRFMFSAALSYRPVDILDTRFSVGLDNRSSLQRLLEPIGFVVNGNPDGEVTRFNRDFNSVTMDAAATLSYPQTGTWSNALTFGVQGFRDDISTVFGEGEVFALPGAPEIDEAANIDASESNEEVFNGGLFFEDQISLWDRLYVNAGLRVDANTSFGEEISTAVYPKLGAAYILSDEPLFADVLGSFLSDLKVRAAYGQTGKAPPPFLRDRTFSATSFRGESAPTFDNPGNVELGPEETSTLEAGLDLSAFNDRVGLGVTWYDATTDDALLEVPEQPVTGLGTQIRNVGKISNTGWELEGTIQLMNRANTLWNVTASYATVRNRVEDMGSAAPFEASGDYQYVCGPPNDCIANGEGRLEQLPVGVWRVEFPIDTNDDALLDATERFYLCDDGTAGVTGCDEYATPFPRHSGSVGTDLMLFNRLTFSVLTDWATGFWAMDWGSIWATFNGVYRREILEDDYQYPIRYDLAGDSVGPYFPYSAVREFMVDGDFMKLREISTSYTIPSDWAGRLGANRASVYFSMRNVAIWSKTPMIDPELNGVAGGDGLLLGAQSSITLSPPKMFRFGVELSF